MQYIRPAQPGRVFNGQTPFGVYAIHLYRDHDGPVYDGDGNELGTVQLTIKTPESTPPAVLTAEQKNRMAERLKVCESCEHSGKIGVATVKCNKCKTCGHSLNLISESSTCPMGKWSN